MHDPRTVAYLQASSPCLSCKCCPALFQVTPTGEASYCYTCLLAHGQVPRRAEAIEEAMGVVRSGPPQGRLLLALFRELTATEFLDDVGTLPTFMLCRKQGFVAA